MSEYRVNFFGLAEDKLYYDERKKRFVNTKNMPANMEREMRSSAFKFVSRPKILNKLFFSNVQTCTGLNLPISIASSSMVNN